MHPVQVYAKEEPKNIRQQAEFVEGKILTRLHVQSRFDVFGDLTVTESGLQFQEKGGIDFQADHRSCPWWGRVPFHLLQQGTRCQG